MAMRLLVWRTLVPGALALAVLAPGAVGQDAAAPGPGALLVVEGHTDAVGGDAYNQTLSEQRAASLRSWLVAHGALDAATPVKGFAKTRPIAPNTGAGGAGDLLGRQRNRRVEIVADTCGRA